MASDDLSVTEFELTPCSPGRWYAVMVMKHLMAYLLLNYDIKLPDSAKGVRPADLNIASVHLPNSSAHVLFRRRNPDQKD
jgi:hypothetical protein